MPLEEKLRNHPQDLSEMLEVCATPGHNSWSVIIGGCASFLPKERFPKELPWRWDPFYRKLITRKDEVRKDINTGPFFPSTSTIGWFFTCLTREINYPWIRQSLRFCCQDINQRLHFTLASANRSPIERFASGFFRVFKAHQIPDGNH